MNSTRSARAAASRSVAALACLVAACGDAPPDGGETMEFKQIPGLFGASATPGERDLRSFGIDRAAFDHWTRSHGDNGSTKYSALAQIDRSNVATLEVAWMFDGMKHSDGQIATWKYPVQANPIVAGRTLYSATPDDGIVALDAATGELEWEFRAPNRPAVRGLVYWEGDDQTPARLYFPAGRSLLALDARTGRLDPTFGTDGAVPIRRATAAPAIAGERLLVAINKPASLRAFDLRSGEPLWNTELRKIEGVGAGCSPWGGFSVDEQRQLAFMTTGNPRPAMIGTGRRGDNPHCNSVVAIDLGSGEIVWTFQEVAHDLWNFDIAAPPALTTIEIEGEAVDVVAAATKIGNTLLLERDSGRPVFDYRLRRAPASKIPLERTAEYQPDLELPEPFMRAEFRSDDITNIAPASRDSIRFQLENAVYGFFQPPEIGRRVVVFGLHGGAEWPGVAIDPDTSWLYVPINRIPWQLLVFLRSRSSELPDTEGRDLYLARCQRCHGALRGGAYNKAREVITLYAPSLIGTTRIATYNDSYEAPYFHRRHAKATDETFSQAELDLLRRYFVEVDRAEDEAGQFEPSYQSFQLIDHQGYPGSKPPWGQIVALDLTTGRIQWAVPFGEYAALTRRGVPKTGQPNYGGLIATRGGLVFATGTVDKTVRAFDSRTGEELWVHALPAAGSAPPTTYEIDGQQFLVAVATGGRFHGFRGHSGAVIAFALPQAGPD